MAIIDRLLWKASAMAILVALISVLSWPILSQSLPEPAAAIVNNIYDLMYRSEGQETKFYILSYEPLMIYMVNFIKKAEREHLLALAEPRYSRSETTLHDGTVGIGNYRTSSSAPLPSNDDVIQAIIKRAADMQGFMAPGDFEAFQAVRYGVGQKFDPHYDWYHNATEQNNTARITSIFATLQSNCTNCGTQFPHVLYDWASEDPRLCEFVDCSRKELTIKPIEGNALFWRNLLADGTGDERTLHAGLPLESGSKVGLNIFARTTLG